MDIVLSSVVTGGNMRPFGSQWISAVDLEIPALSGTFAVGQTFQTSLEMLDF